MDNRHSEPSAASQAGPDPVLLFDGVCNLCSGAVRWVIARDHEARIRFASLQSEYGQRQTLERSIGPEIDSLVLIVGTDTYLRSEAVLRLAGLLPRPWNLARGLLIIPRFLRDPVYRFVATHRYGWFGHSDECWIPTRELQARFVDHDPAT